MPDRQHSTNPLIYLLLTTSIPSILIHQATSRDATRSPPVIATPTPARRCHLSIIARRTPRARPSLAVAWSPCTLPPWRPCHPRMSSTAVMKPSRPPTCTVRCGEAPTGPQHPSFPHHHLTCALLKYKFFVWLILQDRVLSSYCLTRRG